MVFRFLQVESFEDLQDVLVMLEMVRVIAGGGEGAVTTPNATPPQRIRAGLLFLAEKDGKHRYDIHVMCMATRHPIALPGASHVA